MSEGRILEALDRIEQRQHAYEIVTTRMLQTLESMTEMLSRTYKGSEQIAEVVDALNESTVALRELPDAIVPAVQACVREALYTDEDGNELERLDLAGGSGSERPEH